jgi:hypothetical protein
MVIILDWYLDRLHAHLRWYTFQRHLVYRRQGRHSRLIYRRSRCCRYVTQLQTAALLNFTNSQSRLYYLRINKSAALQAPKRHIPSGERTPHTKTVRRTMGRPSGARRRSSRSCRRLVDVATGSVRTRPWLNEVEPCAWERDCGRRARDCSERVGGTYVEDGGGC